MEQSSYLVPHPHRAPRLGHQRIPDIPLTPAHPATEALLAQGPQGLVHLVGEELGGLGGGVAHDEVEVHFEFLAKGLEGEIVDVVAKGVFEFAADGDEAEDDICGDYFC